MGDTGVAVNPNDERYQDLVGKTCILPIMNREIPIVADEYVEMDFGTGCVKMTPAHDPNDFEVGLRHNLEVIRVLDDNGKVNENGGKYKGMDRYECPEGGREGSGGAGAAGKDRGLQPQRGHLLPLPQRRGAHHLRPVVRQDGASGQGGHASGEGRRGQVRPRALLQDLYSTGWRTSTTGASPASSGGATRSPPGTATTAARSPSPGKIPPSASTAAARTSDREEDVLDTWFSSALWPFSTLGWPDKDRGFGLFLSHRRAGHRL